MKADEALNKIERISEMIHIIRNERVMFDSDLAALYGVETYALTQAVKRNLDRFPTDFMFQLTTDEYKEILSSQIVSSSSWGGRRYPPYAFTEQGVAHMRVFEHVGDKYADFIHKIASLVCGLHPVFIYEHSL